MKIETMKDYIQYDGLGIYVLYIYILYDKTI